MVHKANSLWHSDSTFKPIPALASFLSAKIVPPKGAETEFASTIFAWDDLPDETKAKVDGKIAHHHVATSQNQVSELFMLGRIRDGSIWRTRRQNPSFRN